MRRSSPEKGFTLLELLIVVVIIGSIAAIAIPGLLRARVSANESAAIADIRTVLSAEAAYRFASDGLYGEVTCLSVPSSCIANYPAGGPTFLDPTMAALTTKGGYARSFVGQPLGTGLGCFAYIATPASPGRTGIRGFGGDCSGRICFTQDGTPPPIAAGELAPGCSVIP